MNDILFLFSDVVVVVVVLIYDDIIVVVYSRNLPLKSGQYGVSK